MTKSFVFGFLAFMAVVMCWSCQTKTSERMAEGSWLGTIAFDSVDQVPFNFEVRRDSAGEVLITVINANERINITEIIFDGDSVEWHMPVFQSVFRAGFKSKGLMGWYYPKGKENGGAYHFTAVENQSLRFPHLTQKPVADLTGRWKIVENPGAQDEAILIGEFEQEGMKLTGTILSPFGDYRYLEGVVSGSIMTLSGFDGCHAIVLNSRINRDGTLSEGRFAGSHSWKSNWIAQRDDSIQLPSQQSLVRIKPGSPKPAFSLKDINGKLTSLTDEKFSDKVVVILVSGTWCPNCMDEARLFSRLYDEYKDQGLEVVSLFFETADFDESVARIRRFSEHTGLNYTLLWAGKRDRQRRDSLISIVEGQMAFPTTIFLDRKGNARFVETGFSGPGTGNYYDETVADIKQKIELLLNAKD